MLHCRATWLIGKNYAHFADLDGELRKEAGAADTLPSLPKKSSFGRSKEAVIAERQVRGNSELRTKLARCL